MASVSHCPAAFAGNPVTDVLRSSSSGLRGVPLRALAKTRVVSSKTRDFSISAKIRKTKKHERPWPEDPDPNVKGGILYHLSHFKVLKEKPKPVTLEFEKPLVDLEKKITEVRKMADETGLDFSDQILSLENKYHQALKDLYTHLTPIQRVNIARHPNRPTFLDHVFSITEKFVELHGDRQGYDDPAIVTGIGTIDGDRYMFIGHQKGRNTKENIKRNFGMPTPHGYRKALRMMNYADHHGFPIVTFIDTPGAFADLKSEELGQGEAIAQNLRTMFGLEVPIISIVIGEGGSGGALAIGCANKLLMLENAVFYVASPEACAAILWKSAKASPKAAEKLKITATELCKLQIADDVIPEPLGGAHADPAWTSNQIKIAIKEGMKELKEMNTEDLLKHRMLKFRKIGGFQEGIPIDPKRKFNMKKKDEGPLVAKAQRSDLEGEVEKVKQQVLKAKESSGEPSMSGLDKAIHQLQNEVELGFSEAAKALGFEERFAAMRDEFSKLKSQDLTVNQDFKNKLDKLKDEFNQSLPKAANYESLQNKIRMLKELSMAKNLAETKQKASSRKQEVNKKFREVMQRKDVKEKFDALKAEILSSGASKFDELDQKLVEKVMKLKNELEVEFADVLQLFGMDVEAVKSSTPFAVDSAPTKELQAKMKELNREIQEEIDSVTQLPEVKNKIELLKLEIVKAGKNPNAAARERLAALEEQIKQTVASALESSGLREKHHKLKREIAEAIKASGKSEGSLETEENERMKINVSANSTFA